MMNTLITILTHVSYYAISERLSGSYSVFCFILKKLIIDIFSWLCHNVHKVRNTVMKYGILINVRLRR